MSLSFFYQESSLVAQQEIDFLCKKLEPEIVRMALIRGNKYQEYSGFINLPFDVEYQARIIEVAEQKRTLKPKLLLLIGIGGSNLGTLAVHEALLGQLYNNKNPDIALYCADTLDDTKTRDLMFIIEAFLQRGEVVLVVVVTKSGTTTETMVNAALFIDLLKKYRPFEYQSHCIMITDKNSNLDKYAHEIGSCVIEIPAQVGGRFSVFSAVSLVPLAILGVDIKGLCEGAAGMVELCVQSKVENYAMLGAALLFHHYKNGIDIHDSFFFDASHEFLGKWYRQLMAESLGKKYDCMDNEVEVGMTPTVSMGTVDLHSMVQLYLGGPRNRFTTFVQACSDENLQIPQLSLLPCNNATLSYMQKAIFDGTQKAYLKNKRPFVTVMGLTKDAATIGAFLQWKMLEIVYLGFLMQVNPFDQPQVELYKKEVIMLLSNNRFEN